MNGTPLPQPDSLVNEGYERPLRDQGPTSAEEAP